MFGRKKSKILEIYPYRLSGTAYVMDDGNGNQIEGKDIWVFDDHRVGLQYEALVSGTDLVADYITQPIKDAENGFKLIFSDEPFEGYQLEGKWVKEGKMYLGDIIGNWYVWNHPNIELPNIPGWLCPALFLYFENAPKMLYIRAEAKN